jgi:transposase-like protein
MVRQIRKSRLLVIIQNSLLEQFAADVSDRTADELVGVNRNTAILYFHKMREIIAQHSLCAPKTTFSGRMSGTDDNQAIKPF